MATTRSAAATKARKGGSPPKAHQFKPGQSGNPKGRPRKEESLKSVLRDVLGEELEVMEGGRPVRMTARRAVAKKALVNLLQSGNPKLLRLLLEFDQPEPQVQANGDMRAQQDAQACEAVLATLKPATAPEATATSRAVLEEPSSAGGSLQACDADEQLHPPSPQDR